MSNGCREIFTRRSPNAGRAVVALWLGAHLAATTPALALPQDGQVTAGEGAIEQTSASTLLIQQRTQRMAADFRSFDIAAGEAVNILQPGRSAVFLGNITGESATTIFGTLTANGQVILVNPRGVVFGESSRVDTAALVATSLGVDVDAFMDGAIELEFAAEMAGRIVNRGVIEAASGGSVTLLGDEVVNEGLIVAELGQVNLASGSRAVLTFDVDGLVGVEVTEAALGGLGGDAGVLNSGTIEANGGQIFLEAAAARDLFDKAVNNEGILRANGAREVNGEIVLTSTADTFSSGELLATNDAGVGGRVDVLGERVAVTGGTIDVSGSEGGGRVRIGGDFRGAGALPSADRSYVGPDARIAADATRDGDGGEVVVWGDTEIRYFGRTSARGGAEGGDGGFVELSTRENFEIGGEVDTSAPNGATGTLLVDPTDIFIVDGTDGSGTLDDEVDPGPPEDPDVLFAEGGADTTISVGALQALGDTNITLEATDQITVGTAGGVAADVDLSGTLTTGTLTLSAGNGGGGAGDITFNVGSRIETGGGGVTLEAGQAGDTSGSVTLGEVVTAGGTLTIDALGDIDVEAPTSVGDLSLDAGGSIRFAGGTIDATGAAPITFDSPVVLLADLAIISAGDVAFNATVDGDGVGGAETLTLDAGGTIDFAAGAVVGGTDPLANLVVADSTGATLADAVTLTGAFDVRNTAGTVTVGGDLNAATLTTAGTGYTLNLLEDVSVTAATNFLNTGALALGDGADDVQVFAGGLATAGNATNPTTTRIGGTLQSTAQDITLGPVTLGANALVDAAGGALSIQSVTSGGGFDLVLDGGSGAVAVTGAVVGVGDLELRDSGGAVFGGSVEAGAVTLTATTGAIDFQGVLTATSLSAGAAPFSVDFDAAPNVTGLGDFDNTGGLAFAAGGLFGGGLEVSSSTTAAAGALTTTGGAIVLQDLDLSADAVLDSAGGAIALQAVASNGFALALDGSDMGSIDVASLAGDGDLTVTDSAGTTFVGGVAASTVTLTDTTGVIAFQGDTTISTQLATASQPYEVSFTGTSTSVAGDTTFASTGTITLGDAAGDAVTFAGGLDTRSAVGTRAAGSVSTSDARLDLGDLTLTGDLQVRSGSGALQIASATDGPGAFVLSLQDDTVASSGAVTVLGGVTLNTLQTFGQAYAVNLLGGGTIDTDTSFQNTTLVTLGDTAADDITFSGGLDTTAVASTVIAGGVSTADAQIDLGATTLAATSALLAGSGAINVVSATDGAGAFGLSVQDASATGAVTFAGALDVNALTTFAGPYAVGLDGGGAIASDTNFLNTGALRIGDDATDAFSFVGGLDTTAGPSGLALAGTISTGNQTMGLGDATLGADVTLRSGAGAIIAGAISDGGADFTLTLQDDTVASTGTVAIGGDLDVADLITFGQSYSVALTGSTTVVDAAVDFLNSGTVTLGDGGDVLTFSGGLASAGNVTNPSATILNGAVVGGTGTAIALGAVSLAGDSSLTAPGAAALTTGAIDGAAFDLSLDGDAGAVTLASFSSVAALTLVDASTFDVAGASSATTVDLNGTRNGTYSFADTLTAVTLTTNAGNASGVDDLFTLDLGAGASITDAVVFDNEGDLLIGGAGTSSIFTGGLDTTAVTGLVAVGGAVRSPAGLTIGDLALVADTTLDTAGGDMDVGTVTSNGNLLELDGGAAGLVTVASLGGDGDLLVTDSASTRFTGLVDAATVTLLDSTGTISFEGATDIGVGLVTSGNAYSVSFLGASTAIAGTTSFLNGGTLTLGDGGDVVTFDTGVVATEPTVIDLNGTVAVNSGVITLGDGDTTLNIASTTTIGGSSTGGINLGLANLADGVTLTVGTGIANAITIAGVAGTPDAGATIERLVIDTTGAVTVTDAVGASDGSNDLDQLELVQSGGATFEGTVDAGSVVLTDTTGTIAFEDVTRIGTSLVTTGAGYDLAFTGAETRIAGATDFLNTGNVRFGGDLSDVTEFVGGVNTRGNVTNPALTILEGTLRTGLGAGQDVDLGSTRLVGPATIVAGGGAVSAADVTDQNNGFGLTVQDAGATGAVSIGGFQLGALTTRGGAYDVSLLDSGTVTGDTNFLNTGAVVLGDQGDGIDTLNFLGGLATAGNVTNPSVTLVNAAIISADTRVDLGATTIAGATTLRSGDGAIAIASVAGSGQSLGLQTAGDAGSVTIDGDATVGTLLTGGADFDIAFNAGAGASTTTLEGATVFGNTGRVSFGENAGDVTVVGGALSTTAALGGTELAGLLTTQAANGSMDLSASTLNADAVVSSGSGVITLAAVTGAGLDLALQDATAASTGAVTIAGPVTLGSLRTFAQGYDVSLLGGGTVTAATDFLNAGALTLGDEAVDVLTFGAGLVTTNAAGPLDLAGTLRTVDADMRLRPATLTADTRLVSGSGAIAIASLTDGASAFTLQLQDPSAVGAVTIDGALTVNRLVTAAGAYDVALLGGATIDLDTSFINLGTVTLGDDVGDSSVFLGGLATTGAASTSTAGRIATAGGDLDLGATTLTAETMLESDGGSLNVGAVSSGGARLALDGAAGVVRIASFLGLGDIEIVDSGGATFAGPVQAGTVTLTDTTGTIEFAGDTSIDTELVTSASPYALALSGSANTIEGPAVTRFLNTGLVTLGDDAGDVTAFAQGVDTLGGPAATAVAGRITTGGAAAQAITLNATTLTANTTLVAGAGSVSIASVTEGGNGFGLTVQDPAATGAVSIGAFQLGALTTAGGAYDVSLLDAGTVSGDTNFLNTGVVTLGDQGAGVDVLSFDGGLDTTNNSVTNIAAFVRTEGTQMDLGPVALTGDSTLRSGAGALNVESVAGPGRTLVLQDTVATGAVSVAGDLTVDSLVVGAGAYDIAVLGGATITSATSFLNAGTVTLGDAATDVTTFVGGLETTVATATVAAGIVATTGAPMLLSPLTLTDTTTLVTDTAGIVVASISGPGQTLNLQTPGATGSVTVNGDVRVGQLDTASGAYDVALLGGGSVAAATDFRNTGLLTLGDDVDDQLTFSGGLDSTLVTGGTRIAGEVSTDDAPLSLGATTLLVDAALESGAGAMNLASVDGPDRRLALQSLTATGPVTFAGDVTLGALDTFSGAYDVTFAGGGTITSDTTFRNRGVVTLGDDAGDLITFTGGLDTVGAGATRLDGTVVSADADIDLGATVLTGAATVRAGSGSIDFASVDDAAAGLTLAVQDAAATGAVRFLGEAQLGALETFAGAYDVSLLGGGRIAADTTFLNTTRIVIGDDASDATLFAGGLDTRSALDTSLAGMLMATDAQIDLGAISLLGPTTVIGGAGAVNVASVTGGSQVLTLQDADSSGSVTVLGRFDDLASLVSADGDFSLALEGGGEVIGATRLRNSGLKLLGDEPADGFRFVGGLSAEAGTTRLLGSFTSVATDLDFGATEIAGPTTLTTGDGTLRAGVVDGGAAALTIDAGDGSVVLQSFANGGAVTFTEAAVTTVAGDFGAASLTLNGGSSFTVGGELDIAGALSNVGTGRFLVEGGAELGSLTSEASAGELTFLGDATIDGALSIVDGAPADAAGDASALTVGGALVASSVTVTAPDVAVALEGSVDVSGATRLQTAGGVRLGNDGATQAFRGGLSISGPVTTFASISVDSGPLELAAVTQAGTTSFASGGQAITTGAIASEGFDLAIDAATGDVMLGSVERAARLELRAGGDVGTGDLSAAVLDVDAVSALTVEGVFELGAIDTGDMNGSLLFRGAGAVTGEQATVFANEGGLLFEAAPVAARNVTVGQGGSVELAAGTFAFGGGLDTQGTAVTLNDARLATENGSIVTAGLTIGGSSALDSTLGLSPEAGAPLTLTGLVAGDGASLDLFAGTGDVDVQQTVELGSFAVRSGSSLTLNDVTTTGNSVRAVVSGDVSLNGDITALQGDVVIISTDGLLSQFVALIDPDVEDSQTTGEGAIVRASTGDAILAAKDFMTVNLVEAPQGDILLALLGPADPEVVRGIFRGQSFGAISNEGSGSADLIAGGTLAVVAAEQAEFGNEDNGFLIVGDGQFITLDGGDSFIQQSNAATLQILDGGVAQDFASAFDPLFDDPLRPFETQVDAAVFGALSAALVAPVSATARRTSSVSDSEDALAQQADEDELLTNLSEDAFQDIRLVSQDQQPLCLPETLQGFDSVGCAAGADQAAAWVDEVVREFPGGAEASAADVLPGRRAESRPRRLGYGAIGGAGEED